METEPSGGDGAGTSSHNQPSPTAMSGQEGQQDAGANSASGTKPSSTPASSPICLIVLGMAGSGKTTFVQRLTSHLHAKNSPPYVINLDPAVKNVPYPANVDIRDTVKYKEVMRQYGLGPNGAIMTCLNLFSTRFDQAIALIDQRKDQCEYVLMDTPGQIEVFTWSASGAIITETLASVYPTVIAYVMDSARSTNPVTFMSNMLYACSILYRTKLPFIVVLNKADVVKPTFAMQWMKDFESFQQALESESTYMHDLTRSLSLVLDEFYSSLKVKCAAVSALTGEGMDDFILALKESAQEFERDYRPEYQRMCAEKAKEKAEGAGASSNVGKKLAKMSIREKAAGYFCTGSEMTAADLPDDRVHLGGVEAENAEDDKQRIYGVPITEEDDTEEDRESFQRFMDRVVGDKKKAGSGDAMQ